MKQKGENKKLVEEKDGKLTKERGCWELTYNFEVFFQAAQTKFLGTTPPPLRPSVRHLLSEIKAFGGFSQNLRTKL
jgi:hypothetical protein